MTAATDADLAANELLGKLTDHVVVKGAAYSDGLLTIDLAREVPEAMRPRRIEIGGAQVTSLEDRARPRGRRAA